MGHTGAACTNSPRNHKKFPLLPKGLVGTKSTGQIQIKGNHFNCLLDSGSQVTTIPYSFYNTYLSDHPIKPLNDLLEVEGANGQAVPYPGYIEINMTFPADFLGSSINVDTLALVVPDVQQSPPMILVGTNTLDVAYSKHCDTLSEQSFLPTGSGYIAVYKILQCRHVQNSNDQYAP